MDEYCMNKNKLDKGQLCKIIIEKLDKITNRKTDGLEEKQKDQFLTGAYWNLSAEQMVYLYYEICHCFQIQIEAGELEQYRFATVNRIVDLVTTKMTDG